MALRTDYTDAVWSGNKKYKMINNTDGTVSFEDVTEYTSKENGFFGANDANTMNSVLNTYKSQTDTNTSDISTNTSDIATIKTQLTDGATVNAGLWGGLTQDTATNNTTSTQILVRNGSKVQVTNAATLINLVPTILSLKDAGCLTSLVTTDYDSYILAFGSCRIFHINAYITASGTIVQNIPTAYQPVGGAHSVNVNWSQGTSSKKKGYWIIEGSTIKLINTELSTSLLHNVRQTIIYY